jgi:hypothetical protein
VSFTPGPWRCEHADEGMGPEPDRVWIRPPDGTTEFRNVAFVNSSQANARLIAAAPEMRERYAELVALHCDRCDHCPDCALLARIDGKDPPP